MVEFSEDTTIAGGVPRLEIILASGNRYADYIADTNPRAMTFRYQVQEGDLDGDGLELGNGGHIDLQGASIKGGADMDAQLTALNFSGLDQVKVDGVKPSFTVAAAPGHYKNGESILLTVTFSKSVVVSGGTPQIILEVGSGQDVNTVYQGISSTAVVATPIPSTILVQEGQNDNDGIRVLGILLPVGARIEDANGNPAVLNNAQTLAEVILDNIPPSLRLELSGSTWNWDCGEESCSYRYAIIPTKDDRRFHRFSSSDTYQNVSSATPATKGEYSIYLQAIDTAGNKTGVRRNGPMFYAGPS